MEISTQSLVRSRPPDSPEGQLAKKLIRAHRVDDSYVAQLQTDITAFPKRWLERFEERHLAVAVLKDNQTLADTSVLRALEPEDIAEIAPKARPLIHQAIEDLFGPLRGKPDEEYLKYQASGELQERLHEIANQELGFTVAVGREQQSLEYLAETLGFEPSEDPESFQRWSQCFLDINQDLVEHNQGMFKPKDGVYVIPYVMYRGKAVRSMSLPSYQAIKGLDFQNNLGANYPENSLVVLHDSILPNPNPRAGKHRVVLHELGHALDWICKDLPETRESHENQVQHLYQLARQKEAQGEAPFLTDRARDSSGEMMAEAVEAYLTVEESGNHYKPENHRENLQKSFPELYQYVDYLINL